MFIGTKEQLLNAIRTMPIRGGSGGQCVAAEAADEIELLTAENERLREALRIISASVFNDNGDVTYDTSGLLKAARIAKEALK